MIDLLKAVSYDKEDGITPLLSCCIGLQPAGSKAIFCKRPRLLAWGVFFFVPGVFNRIEHLLRKKYNQVYLTLVMNC